MKKILAISLVAFLASCGGSDDDIGSTSSGLSNSTVAEGSAAPGATTAAESSVFLASAYQDGAAEIALSELALDKATNEEVRAFAQRMIDHHTQSNAQISALAQANGISLPSGLAEEASTTLQTLTNLTGPEFDKAYMQHNVTVHERDVRLFRGQIAAAEAETSGSGSTTGATANVGPAGATAGTGSGSATANAGTNGSTTEVDTSGGSANVNVGTSTDATTTGAAGTDAASSLDASIQTFVGNTLPALQAHLLAAKGLNGRINPSAFLVNLYQDGLGEILLSTLALEKASNPEVRAYAQRMIADHTPTNNQITQLAQAKGVALPTETSVEHRAAYEDLVDMEGADFDKAYMNHNVLVHDLAVVQAEAQAASGTDTDIRAFAVTTAPVLVEHLQEATEIFEAIEPSALFMSFQDGLGEVLLAQLALQKSTDEEVRELAQTIITDQEGIRADILALAQENETALPMTLSPEQLRSYLELAPLPAEEFDDAYVERNATDRARNIALIQQGAAEVTDTNVRALVDEILATLSRHSARAMEIGQGSTTAPAATL